ncbi:polysaccharide deacetylase family protein [Plantactinospora sp. KLBMP9567]|uniref:polysaccharide deacetylase family protein n=1 Tax=Plantactinospora sp. KLBMP9567 TaxID=3085900 RepID=UPI002981E8DC|nr:polysaccharide deacetylase family protein [Plantactinospora sp. KLBMP9567]MDW5327860.1 polysaccharide deacetylase family protein [Plantactinospora sp. KLBMP9567]
MTRRTALAAGLVLLVLLSTGCANEKPLSTRSPLPYPPIPQVTATASAAPTAPPTKPSRKKPVARGTVGPLNTQRLTGVRGVALTFDDGPHPQWTPKVLDQLRRAGVRATFCVVGVKVRAYPALVRRIVREGHTLCNHSWQHDLKLGKKNTAQIRADLRRTDQAIQRAVPGIKVRYYRQPGGKWTPSIVAVAKSLGMKSLHWDVDPADWDDTSASEIRRRVAQQARPGSIVLLHDGGGDRSRTLGACPQVITSLKRKYGITRLR